MGRDKKSAEEKRREGNPGKRKIEDDPEIDFINDLKYPRGMPKKQIVFWNLYAPYMVKNNLLTNLNKTDLARLCYFEAQLEKIHKFLMNEDLFLQDKKNYRNEIVGSAESVYSKMSRNYTAVVRVLKADLRIRTDKVKAVPKKTKSKFDGLMGK
jgi:hypothetical protein